MNKTLKKTVLLIGINKDSPSHVLMIEKRRGMGVGLLNFPGGKVQELESEEEAAIRECQEETGLTPFKLEYMGKLEFQFPKSTKNSWSNSCSVFFSSELGGSIQEETEECRAYWQELSNIPYDKMWETDREWLPLVLAKKQFHIRYQFDEHNKIIHRR